MNPWIKYLITAAVIVLVSEAAKKSDKLGALLVSLPMVTILAMVWIFLDAKVDGPDEQVKKLADHASYTFWYVIPTLPMFLVMPVLFKKGMHFGLVMLIYCLGTIALFYLWAKILERFNIHLM